MRQSTIKKLLVEASRGKCSQKRQSEILRKLLSEAEKVGPAELDMVSGMSSVLCSLFEVTAEHRRQLLPNLFVAFAMMCGEKEDGLLTEDIEWSLAD